MIIFLAVLVFIGQTTGQGDNIIRPCSKQDLKCIQHVLFQQAICLPTYEPRMDPYIVDKLAIDIAHANVTMTVTNMKLKGFSTGRIEEFFINKKTDSLVLEVEFENLIIESPRAGAIYHQRGKEPIETYDYSNITYKNLSFTLVVKHISDVYQTESHVFAYLPDSNPVMVLGPGLQLGDEGMNSIWRDTNMFSTTIKEAMQQQAPVYLKTYLNNWICNVKP